MSFDPESLQNPKILQRNVQLAGADDPQPLIDVAKCMTRLESLFANTESDWDLLPLLRKVALGQEIDDEQHEALIRESLLEEDGSLHPTTRAVVLSAVRGEESRLHLDSPYTETIDRVLGDYVAARLRLNAALTPADVREVLRYDPQMDVLSQLRDFMAGMTEEDLDDLVEEDREERAQAEARRQRRRERNASSMPTQEGATTPESEPPNSTNSEPDGQDATRKPWQDRVDEPRKGDDLPPH